MSSKKILFFILKSLFLFYFIINLNSADMPLFVNVKLSKNKIYIGEKITLTIEIKYDKSYSISNFSPHDYLTSFEVKDYKISKEKKEFLFFGKKILKYEFLLSTFISGKYEIPQMSIKFKDSSGKEKELLSQALKFEVMSKISEKDVDIKDIKPPTNIRISKIYYILIFGIPFVIIIAYIIYQYYFKKQEIIESNISQLSPYEAAMEFLSNLEKMDLSSNEKIKEYYFQLSEILRKYLGEIYKINLIDMTTNEIVKSLKNNNVSRKTISVFIDFSGIADLVKFAKYFPDKKESENSMNIVKEIIEMEKK